MNNEQPSYNAIKEFVGILIKYMEKFGLESIDIAFLAFTNRINIENLLNLQGSIELPRMEAIAQSFGLHHYQFSNPDQVIPEYESLPERTRRRIVFRKEKGTYIPETKNSTTVNDKITVALSFFDVNEKFLTEEIAAQINNADSDMIFTTSLVGDRLIKSFSNYVEKTTEKNEENRKVGAKPFYFRIKAKIPDTGLKKSIEAVGNYWVENFKEINEKANQNKK